MSEEYRIVTIADFDKVPDDRLSACVQEFVSCLFEFRQLRHAGLRLETFTWVDDGIPLVQSVEFEGETIPNPVFPVQP